MKTGNTLILVLVLLAMLVPLDFLTTKSSNNFDTIHQEVLETNPDDVTSSNFDVIDQSIKDALEDYDALSDKDKEEFEDDYQTLLDLQVALDVITYLEDNSEVLDMTVEEVTIDDEDDILTALEEYDALDPSVQSELEDEEEHLNALLEEINELREIDEFITNHATVLGLTPETVTLLDRDAVEAALEDYDNLNPEAQERLEEEKTLLDSLLVAITALEVEEYLTTHATILGLIPDTIQFTDRDAVIYAIEDYNLLSEEAKAELVKQRVLIMLLEDRIEILEQVYLFETDYATELGLTPSTVAIEDKTDIEAALAAYDLLRPQAQTELVDEKALLDSLLEEIVVLEDVETYKTDYNTELGLIPSTVGLTDRTEVEAALVAYDLLSPEAQAKLTDEKALLDSLLEEIVFLEEAEAFMATESAVLGLTPETVTVSDRASVEAALVAYDTLSPEAQAKLTDEKALLDSLLAEITILEEAAEYTVDYSGTLALTPETVQVSDKADVEAALTAYDTLSPEAQAKLTAEKALLDSLLAEIAVLEESNTFKMDHAGVLALTPATVQISDKANVEAALAAYDLLSPEAQATLLTEKALLDSLLAQINVLEEIEEFETDHAGALVLTPSTVQISDKAEIEAALSAYDLLSPEAQTALLTEKALLDSLLAQINVLEEIEGFETDHSVPLALTTGTVQISDKTAVEAALAAYDLLSAEAQAELTTEKALLDDLLDEITILEEIETFETDHAGVLALTPATVQITNKAAVEAALEAYDLLSAEAQAALLPEKALLDSLHDEITVLEGANGFKITHAVVLGLTPATVELTDKAAVELALSDYDLLSPASQAELAVEKAVLDSLLIRVTTLEDVDTFKLDNSEALALTTGTVELVDKADVEAALAAYDLLSPEAQAELTAEKALLDDLATEIAVLEEVDTFKTDHAGALALTLATVQISDKADVEAALAAYDLLSPEAQAKLVAEKALLDSLLVEIIILEDVEEFEANHAGSLALTPATVQISDKAGVEAALAAYDLLSPEAQVKLLTEKALLDSLLAEIVVLEEVAQFEFDHSGALALTPGTVQIPDKYDVQAALADYDLLSSEAQAKLLAEKALLDSLFAEIEKQEEVAQFEFDHSGALALTPGTVQLIDKIDVEAALAAYDLLSPEAQAELLAEKALLDSLINEIGYQEEAGQFESDNAAVLALTTGTVQLTDKADVEAALAEYDLLSPEAQAKLVAEKALLDSLLAEIEDQEEAAQFEADHSVALALTPATVEITNKADVTATLAAYDLLSPEAQAKLVAEKALLDSLLAEINVLEEVEGFETDHASVLALTPATVQISDKADVQTALAAYDLLSPEAQAKLATEKALLDNLLAEIEDQEEAALFELNHAGVLALTPATVQISDKTDVEAALAAYDLLSPEAQAKLTAEKALLDSLLEEINAQEEAATFESNHAVVLTLTPATVQLSDKAIVEAALAAYDLLSPEAQAKLADEKALLDSLHDEIVILEGAAGFTTNHAAALALTTGTVQITDKAAVLAALADYDLLAPEAQALLTTEKALLDDLLEQITLLEEIETFESDHSGPLGLTPATVQMSDKTNVEAALTAYDLLSPEAQAALTTEKALLDSLLAEIILLEEEDTFKTDHAGALALTTGTVQISDKAAVEAALAAYDLLSPEAQAKLTAEKALLDDLLAEINGQEDAAEFTVNHAGALALTTGTVDVTDKTEVEAALAAYDLLSPEAQAVLVVEKALLDSLLAEIEDQEEANLFKADHSGALALTTGTVDVTDRAVVEAALAAYDLLSPEAQAKLVAEKALLDSLLAEIEDQEESNQFNLDHAGALALTTGTVDVTDKAAVEAALAAYDLLSPEVQAKLTSEKALLDSLLAEVEDQEEANQFNVDHSGVLALTPVTVDITDKAAVEAALAAYDLLSPEAQVKLVAEKALLDSLLAEINVLEEEEGFETDYAAALALTPATVEITDKADVEAALAAYDLLSPEAQAKLAVEKALLDSLLAEIVVLEDVEEFETDHTGPLGLTTGTVQLSDKAAVEAALAAYDLLSPEAQAKLATKKALLDSLLAEIEDQEEANQFKADHSAALALTPGSVQITDKASVQAALAAYDLLSPEAQAKVVAEKALLDSLLVEITLLEEIDAYETTHAVPLGLTTGTVDITDKAGVQAALAAYDLLSLEAQVALSAEKALLDDLLAEILVLEDAEGFKTTHAPVLALTTGTVQVSDRTAIEAALAAYDLLSPEAQAKLATEKALLDSLLAETITLETAGFDSDHAAVLALTPATVQITDKTDVEAALAAYDLLSPEAQTALATEKALLDSLLVEINVLEEADGFTTDHAGPLGLSTGTVQISDKADVEAALAAYDLLSPEAQAKVAAEKVLLDDLLAEIIVLEAAAGFETDHAGPLGLTIGTVQISDKTDVQAALAAYDLLSPEAQAKLTTEKALLDSLLAEIIVLEEVDGFETDHSGPLGLTIGTVQISDKTDVQAALAAYDLLSPEAQAKLATEKALLDNLLVEINALEDADDFGTDHAGPLGLTVGTVQISDKTDVQAALAAYDLLSPEAQAKLTTEKALLDSLLAEIVVLEEAAGFESDFAGPLGLTTGTVQISDKADVQAALAAYDLLSPEAQAKLATEKALLDSLLAEIVVLEEAAGFISDHTGPLGLTTGTVQISDKTAVEAALAAYDLLSPEAQAKLVAEKALLDSLLAEIIIQEDVTGFGTDHAGPLGLTTGTVQISDKVAVEAALAAYDLLSPEAQADLVTEKALLDSLLAEIVIQEEAAGFVSDHAGPLGETIGSVQISDKVAVQAALAAYDLLTPEAQAKLTTEKALLDSLLAEIVIQEEAAGFVSDHAGPLGLTTGTVQISDKADVQAALAAYDLLTPEAQAKLTTEKALLDSLLAEIYTQEATAFTTTHAGPLGETTGTVQISDKVAVEAALAAYNLLDAEVQALLTTEKALLDSLVAEISIQEANAFSSVHAAALALTVGTVQISDKAIVEAALAAYDSLDANAQAELVVEKALLDSLLAEINTQEANTFKTDHAVALALTVGTVQVSDKAIVDAALAAYDLLDSNTQALLTTEIALLVDLFNTILVEDNSEYYDWESQDHVSLFTGVVTAAGRNWYAENIAIDCHASYDVCIDNESLALKSISTFASQDPFVNGIDTITLWHGALFYTETTFAFKIEYELQSNPGVWLILQDNGSDLIIDVLTGDPLTYVEINVNITESVNIKFIPVIGNTTRYINLDNITIYEHVDLMELPAAPAAAPAPMQAMIIPTVTMPASSGIAPTKKRS